MCYHLTLLLVLPDLISEIIEHILCHLRRKKFIIHNEILSDLWFRLVQGVGESIKFESSLISFVWIEVTVGTEQGTMWLTVVKTASKPMLDVMFNCYQLF